MDKLSYSLGVLLGNSLQAQIDGKDVQGDSFIKGFMAALNDQPLEMDEFEAQEMAQMYLQEARIKMQQKAIEKEAIFLVENGQREGVVTCASGLQYEILVAGTGRVPKIHNQVIAHYEGSLINGTIFDSSIKRGQPAKFPVGNLIRGWQEALQLMPAGSKWRLYIPSKLGYGAKGAGESIPPNATLIFDLELIQVV